MLRTISALALYLLSAGSWADNNRMGCRLPGNTSPSGFICYNHPIFNMDMSHVRERCNAVIPECRNHPGDVCQIAVTISWASEATPNARGTAAGSITPL